MSELQTATQRVPEPGLVQYTHWIYGLHALSVAVGVLTAATIVGSFVFGLPSLIAVIMNYARRSEARDTYLESHFRWQIRTFWFALLWGVIIALVSAALLVVLVGFFSWLVGFTVLGLWVLYRVLRGWLALREGRAVATAVGGTANGVA